MNRNATPYRHSVLRYAALVFALLGLLALLAVRASAQPVIERPGGNVGPIKLQLDAIPTGSLVTMLMRDVMRVPYVISPDVLADRRPMSVRLVIPREKVPERVVSFLRNNGLSVALSGGTVYVGRRGQQWASGVSTAEPRARVAVTRPTGSPLSPEAAPEYALPAPRPVEQPPAFQPPVGPAAAPADAPISPADTSLEVVAYDPAHREPAYFASVLAPLFPSLKFGAQASAARLSDTGENQADAAAADLFLFSGPPQDLDRARRLVQLLDRPRPMVAVKAVVMQVANVQSRASALSILASIGGKRFSLGSFPTDPAGSQFVRLASGTVSAMLSAVREDSRFKVVATPNLAALSGAVATMNSGSQVPTVGAVTVAEGGVPFQSVVYRDSGITLTVRPVVRGQLIEMDVREERSTFVRTTTGVEDSPTLQKSSARASVVLKSGESVVLAGLTEESTGNRREGLLGGLLGVRGREKSDSELLVVVQAEVVPSPEAPPGRFLDLEPEGSA